MRAKRKEKDIATSLENRMLRNVKRMHETFILLSLLLLLFLLSFVAVLISHFTNVNSKFNASTWFCLNFEYLYCHFSFKVVLDSLHYK